MTALIDNKYDAFVWVKKVIDSCIDNSQLQNAYRLVSNFSKIYDDFSLYMELEQHWSENYIGLTDKKLQLLKG
jgi:hypothetical protein